MFKYYLRGRTIRVIKVPFDKYITTVDGVLIGVKCNKESGVHGTVVDECMTEFPEDPMTALTVARAHILGMKVRQGERKVELC